MQKAVRINLIGTHLNQFYATDYVVYFLEFCHMLENLCKDYQNLSCQWNSKLYNSE